MSRPRHDDKEDDDFPALQHRFKQTTQRTQLTLLNEDIRDVETVFLASKHPFDVEIYAPLLSLADIPMEFITPLNRLVSINLSSCDLLEIPDSIGSLTLLETFIAPGNRIEAIPDSLCRCSALKTLILNRNRIRTLPPHFLCLRRLKTLFMCNNLLEDLPAKLFHMPALTRVRMNTNKLRMIPSFSPHFAQLSQYPGERTKGTSGPRDEQEQCQGWADNYFWEQIDAWRAKDMYSTTSAHRLYTYTLPQEVRSTKFYFLPDEWLTLVESPVHTSVDPELLKPGNGFATKTLDLWSRNGGTASTITSFMPYWSSFAVQGPPITTAAVSTTTTTTSALFAEEPSYQKQPVYGYHVPSLVILAADAVLKRHGIMRLRKLCGKGDLSLDLFQLIKDKGFKCTFCNRWTVFEPLRVVHYKVMDRSFKCRDSIPIWDPCCSEQCAIQNVGAIYWKESVFGCE